MEENKENSGERDGVGPLPSFMEPHSSSGMRNLEHLSHLPSLRFGRERGYSDESRYGFGGKDGQNLSPAHQSKILK